MTYLLETMDWLTAPDPTLAEALKAGKLEAGGFARLVSGRIAPRDERRLLTAFERLRPELDYAPVRLAILTDSNLEFLLRTLRIAGSRYRLDLEILLIDYTRVLPSVMDPDSDLYRFRPDFVLHAGFGAQLAETVAEFETGLAAAAADLLVSEAETCKTQIAKHSQAQFIVQTLPATQADVFGSLDRFQPGAPGHETDRCNAALAQLGAPVFDAAKLAARIGTYRWRDLNKYHWTKMPFAPDWAPLYCDALLRLVAAMTGRVKKCLVLDLDNTLWGGVIGDDGLEGIALGQNSPLGEAFLAGQRYYKMLANRGVVLAVCSKNDLANAELPFREHPDMVLKRPDISCFVANWQDKPGNIRAIAEALKLGLDSFVFLDDNPAERAFVRRELPQVAVPEVPDNDPALYPRIIEAAGYFDITSFGSDDLGRVRDYQANAERAAVRAKASDMVAYLRELKMTMQFQPFLAADADRIVQLINRSNQFNLTTRRYRRPEVDAIVGGTDSKTGFTVRLKDRFSDAGLVAVLICEAQAIAPECWHIDTWLMSCRVLGRRAEEATLYCLCHSAKAAGVSTLIGHYIPTAKNGMVKEHFARLGFERIVPPAGAGDGTTAWALEVSAALARFEDADPLPFVFEALPDQQQKPPS